MSTKKITIRHRWDAYRILYEGEHGTLGEAIQAAIDAEAGLDYADLRYADLSGARIRGLRIVGGDFTRSSFVDSRFEASSFVDSSFVDSSFVDSSFVDSSFVDSNFKASRFVDSRFVDSRFVDSRFVDSRFVDSSFVDSSFVDSSFVDSRFAGVKEDLYSILNASPDEVQGLLQVLREGRIKGTVYEGECSCLCGTLATLRGCWYDEIPGVTPNPSRPAERWFLAIMPGNTPENHPIAAITAQWIEEWLAAREGQPVSPFILRVPFGALVPEDSNEQE